MTCAYKADACASLQNEPILPGGYGLLKACRFVVGVLKNAFELAQTCNRRLQRQREHRKLRELDDYLLKDIGLTREQAEHIASKWLWL
ncbi:MAG TPA: DUF1127 domain-containing protein [Pseudolabrys sp.]|nr:DUF1127 domain-containing protein [Pseudolabrys sp.]